MTVRPFRRSAAARGLTLLELVIAMALLVVVFGGATQLMLSTTGTLKRQSESMAAGVRIDRSVEPLQQALREARADEVSIVPLPSAEQPADPNAVGGELSAFVVPTARAPDLDYVVAGPFGVTSGAVVFAPVLERLVKQPGKPDIKVFRLMRYSLAANENDVPITIESIEPHVNPNSAAVVWLTLSNGSRVLRKDGRELARGITGFHVDTDNSTGLVTVYMRLLAGDAKSRSSELRLAIRPAR